MNFRTLDLNLLRVFDVVMVERNVTRAAERLAMSQPAVSNALRRLRDATHEDLFVPSLGGVRPTRHAEALWPTVRSALDRLHDAFEPRSFDSESERRSFTIAMADATAAVLAPGYVEALRDSAVDLEFIRLTTRDPRALLEQGDADIAIGFFPEARDALAASDEREPIQLDALYRCEYVCAMRAGHPLAAPGALTLDAYCAAQHVRVNFAGRKRGFVDEALAELGRKRRVLITVDHFATAASTIRRSDLLTALPRSYVATVGDGLVQRALPFELPEIEVGMLWHRRDERDPAQQWLRELTRRAAATVAAGALAAAVQAPQMPRIDSDLLVA